MQETAGWTGSIVGGEIGGEMMLSTTGNPWAVTAGAIIGGIIGGLYGESAVKKDVPKTKWGKFKAENPDDFLHD